MKSHGAAVHKEGSHPYGRLLLMAGLSFTAMYALMYGMVDRWNNVYLNLNQLYMAGLMTAPMVLIELAVMRAMYRDNRRTLIVAGGSLLALGIFVLALWRTLAGPHRAPFRQDTHGPGTSESVVESADRRRKDGDPSRAQQQPAEEARPTDRAHRVEIVVEREAQRRLRLHWRDRYQRVADGIPDRPAGGDGVREPPGIESHTTSLQRPFRTLAHAEPHFNLRPPI